MKSGEETGWIAADEADLRRRLEEIAKTTEVDDEAWGKIQERIAAATTRATPSRRPVALAAAAAVVAIVLGVLTIVQREDPAVIDAVDEDSTTTTIERRRTTTTDEDDASTTTAPPSGSDGPGDVLTPPGDDDVGSPLSGDGDGDIGPDPSTPPGTDPGPAPSTTTPPTSTTSTTTPPAPTYTMTVSPSQISQGDGVTIQSVTPCVTDEAGYDEQVAVSIIYQEAQVGWMLFGEGGWGWLFLTTSDNQPGVYTVEAQCAFLDSSDPDNSIYHAYGSHTFTIVP